MGPAHLRATPGLLHERGPDTVGVRSGIEGLTSGGVEGGQMEVGHEAPPECGPVDRVQGGPELGEFHGLS